MREVQVCALWVLLGVGCAARPAEPSADRAEPVTSAAHHPPMRIAAAGCAGPPAAPPTPGLPPLPPGMVCPYCTGDLPPGADPDDEPPSAPHLAVKWYPKTQRIDIDTDRADLKTVCERIGRLIGAPVLVDPAVEETLTVCLREIPWREGLEVIAKLTRCELEERPGKVFVFRQPGDLVSIQLDHAPLRTLLQLLAAYAGRDIVLPPQLLGTATVDLRGDVPTMLQGALDAARLPYDVEWGDPIRLRARSRIEVEPRLFELR